MKPQQDIARRAGGWTGAAYIICVLCVYPLYMHVFIDQGLTKFTGYLTLTVLWLPVFFGCALVRVCTLYNAKPLAGWKDPGLLWPLAVLVSTMLSTALSVDPHASTWGLGSYYGGLVLVVCGLLGFVAVRFWLRRQDLELVLGAFMVSAMAVTVLDLLNVLDFDPLGAYAGMAEVERLQFYSTIGQMDFLAGFLSLALPIGVYRFLTAQKNWELALYGAASAVFMLALTCVSADCLLLGTLAFGAALVCLPGFDTVWLRRLALCGAAFFGWDLALRLARDAGAHFNISDAPIAWSLSAPVVAVPALAVCILLWGVLSARKNRPAVPLYRVGRVLVGAGAALVVLGAVCVNLLGIQLPGKLQGLLYFDIYWGNFRGEIWSGIAAAYRDSDPLRWLFGWGPGMTHTRLMDWSGGDLSAKMLTIYAAHNEYLELLLCCGAVGLAAWLGFIISRLRQGFKASADPLTAAVTLGLFAHLFQALVNIRVSMVFPELLVLLGALDMLTRTPAEEPDEAPAEKKTKKTKEKPVSPWSGPMRAASILAAAWVGRLVWWPLSHALFSFLWG